MAVGAVGVGVAALAGKAVIDKLSEKDGNEIINSEGLTKKFNKIFTIPTRDQGSKTYDYIKQRADGSTPRTIGMTVRTKKCDVQYRKKTDDGTIESKTSEGFNYEVIKGNNGVVAGLPTRMKKRFYNLGVKRVAETYDVPNWLITAGDKYLWLEPEAHFVKFNGVKRHLSTEGLQRGWEVSFAKTHENWLEAMGDIPEQYSVLNNRINGQLKLENLKSENFRQFEKLKNNMDKMDAMDS